MKLKSDYPIYIYPGINASLVLTGEPKQIKVEGYKIQVLCKQNGCNLLRFGELGFSWVWDTDIDFTLTPEENAKI